MAFELQGTQDIKHEWLVEIRQNRTKSDPKITPRFILDNWSREHYIHVATSVSKMEELARFLLKELRFAWFNR